MNPIQMVPAFLFTCDECYEECVLPVALIQTDDDTYADLPETVECPKCQTVFTAEYPFKDCDERPN